MEGNTLMDEDEYVNRVAKLAEEADSSIFIFVKDNQLVLIHNPFDTEEEVIHILNNAVANMVMRSTLDKAGGNRLQ
jgi:polyphosphate kinase